MLRQLGGPELDEFLFELVDHGRIFRTLKVIGEPIISKAPLLNRIKASGTYNVQIPGKSMYNYDYLLLNVLYLLSKRTKT